MDKYELNNKNIVSLKEYFNVRFNELKCYMDSKFENIEKSTQLAQENLNTRLESMNEFRSSMKDQIGNYVTRQEYNILAAKYDGDIRQVREAQAESKGKASQQSVNYAYMISFISIIIGIVGIVIKII